MRVQGSGQLDGLENTCFLEAHWVHG